MTKLSYLSLLRPYRFSKYRVAATQKSRKH